MQQFVRVEHDLVDRAQQAQLLGLHGRGRDLGHRHGLEGALELGEHLPARPGCAGGTHRDFLEPATCRQQAHAGLDQPDIALQSGHGGGTVHLELAAAAKRQPAHS